MEHVWSVLCSRAIRDESNKMVSLMDCLDRIEIAGEVPPVNVDQPNMIGPLSLYLVSYWYRTNISEPETGTFRATLVGPNGIVSKRVMESAVPLLEGPSVNSIVNIGVIEFFGWGYYFFEVHMQSADGQFIRVARLPLDFKETGTH
jgi:hypothetical protein